MGGTGFSTTDILFGDTSTFAKAPFSDESFVLSISTTDFVSPPLCKATSKEEEVIGIST
jgi:hypothetical protein